MANNLKKIREQKGISQLRLAYITNISPADISRIENGWRKPFPGWRTRLAKALDVGEDQLFPNGKEA